MSDTNMLQVTIKVQDRVIELPPIEEGQSGSLTDHQNPDKEIVVFALYDNKGYVILSKKGVSVEFLDKRLILSDDAKTESIIEKGGRFTRDIKTKYGWGILAVENIG